MKGFKSRHINQISGWHTIDEEALCCRRRRNSAALQIAVDEYSKESTTPIKFAENENPDVCFARVFVSTAENMAISSSLPSPYGLYSASNRQRDTLD